MAYRIDRKANIFEGLERGLMQGAQLGMNARQLQLQEAESMQRRQLAMQEAQRIDQEFQREEMARGAMGEMAGQLAEPIQTPKGLTAPMQVVAGQDRIQRIAKRLAETGKGDLAIEFVNETTRRRKAHALDQDREKLINEIADKRAKGMFYALDQNGAQVPSPQIDNALDQIGESLANGGDPRAARLKLADLHGSIGKADFEMQQLGQRKESARAQALKASGEGNRNVADAMNMLAASVSSGTIGVREFDAKYQDALMGLVRIEVPGIGPMSVPPSAIEQTIQNGVRIAQEMQALKLQNEQLRGQAIQQGMATDAETSSANAAESRARAKYYEGGAAAGAKARAEADGAAPEVSSREQEVQALARDPIAFRQRFKSEQDVRDYLAGKERTSADDEALKKKATDINVPPAEAEAAFREAQSRGLMREVGTEPAKKAAASVYEAVQNSADDPVVREWLQKNPYPKGTASRMKGVDTAAIKAWEAKAKKDLGEWLKI